MKDKAINTWMDAFMSVREDDNIKRIRDEIENEINEFIKDYTDTNKEKKLFTAIESRIKSKESFYEKMYRDELVYSWTLSDIEIENQKYIMNNLTDLIGFRITCYFYDDEESILNSLLEYNNKFDKIQIENATRKQDNGKHIIRKVKGTYTKENELCKFEIQIKSLVHNFWGEVEHKTIYKQREYNANFKDHVDITEDVYNILASSDRQLHTLYHKYRSDKQKFIYGLFFEYTKDKINCEFNTEIIGKAYHVFFELFGPHYYKNIGEYVGECLLGRKHKKIKPCMNNNNEAHQLMERIKNNFKEYDLKMLYIIATQLFEFINELEFYNIIFNILDESNNIKYQDAEYDFEFVEEDDEIDNEQVQNNTFEIWIRELETFGLRRKKG